LQAAICLPRKNLRANVTSLTSLLGQLQCGLNIELYIVNAVRRLPVIRNSTEKLR